MKKATQQKPAASVNLGTKRACPECGAKFYDFAKSEVVCPKCDTVLGEEDLSPFVKIQNQMKKSKATEKPEVSNDDDSDEESSSDVMESVDDLESGDDVEESIDVDEEEEEDY